MDASPTSQIPPGAKRRHFEECSRQQLAVKGHPAADRGPGCQGPGALHRAETAVHPMHQKAACRNWSRSDNPRCLIQGWSLPGRSVSALAGRLGLLPSSGQCLGSVAPRKERWPAGNRPGRLDGSSDWNSARRRFTDQLGFETLQLAKKDRCEGQCATPSAECAALTCSNYPSRSTAASLQVSFLPHRACSPPGQALAAQVGPDGPDSSESPAQGPA